MDQESSRPTSDSFSNSLDDLPAESQGVVSEKVQYFANAIYDQLEKLVKKYDEEAVKDLMPHVISLLENLDQLSKEKRKLEVDIELVKEDNSQLLSQYEREKSMRRSIEQKCLELDDIAEDERQSMNDKIGSMESIVRMLELKSKNSADHVSRLEEKENEMKRDYQKLYQKYQELMRTHIDIMERRAYNDQHIASTASGFFTNPSHPILPSDLEKRESSGDDAAMRQTGEVIASVLDSEIKGDYILRETTSSGFHGSSSVPASRSIAFNDVQPDNDASSALDGEMRFVEELSFQEEDLLKTRKGEQDSSEDEADDTLDSIPLGVSLGGSEFNAVGRQSTFSVGREFDKLLKENAELLETKNALNVVKDDLIFQVDGLNNELRIYRERIASLEEIREHLQVRVAHLEEEGRRVKDELEEVKYRLSNASASNGSIDEETGSNNEGGLPSTTGESGVTQKRRFTRMEMARVLMERNMYKERLMELQETVRWVESLRANRELTEDLEHRKKSSSTSIWNIFGSLFSGGSGKPKTASSPATATPLPPPPISGNYLDVGRLPTASISTSEPSTKQRSSGSSLGRVEAYGWSIPASTAPSSGGMARNRAATRVLSAASSKPDISIPIPICCQPLPGSLNGMKIWSAAVAFSSVAHHPNGSRLFERSVFYGTNSKPSQLDVEQGQGSVSQDVAELEQEVSLEQHRVKAGRGQLAELGCTAWLTCSSNNVNTHVFLVDLRQPANLLAGFTVDAPYVSQVCAVPGAKPTDIVWRPPCVSKEDGPPVTATAAAVEISDAAAAEANGDGKLCLKEDDCVERSRDGERQNKVGQADWIIKLVGSIESLKVVFAKERQQQKQQQQAEEEEEEEEEEEGGGGEQTSNRQSTDNTKSLLMPSMWFGGQDGSLFIYSATSAVQPAVDDSPQQLPSLLARLQLASAATAVAHVAGRVFVALSDGKLLMFHRDAESKEWVTDKCSTIEFWRLPFSTKDEQQQQQQQNDNNSAHQSGSKRERNKSAVRCLVAVANRYLWVGVGREVLVLEPASLRIESSFICHPRPEAQLRHACSVGDGVWLAVRIDSVLRLYHAFTHQHLQDLDLTPPIHSFLFGDSPASTSSSSSSPAHALTPMRVSALVAGGGRLWIGTHTGLVVSVPFASSEQHLSVKTPSLTPNASSKSTRRNGAGPTAPGVVVQVYASPRSHTLTPSTNMVPYCWVGGAQISCHGHTDSVKAIVCSPIQSSTMPSLGIMSVGEGYRDCRSPEAIKAAVSAGEPVGLSAILAASGSVSAVAAGSSSPAISSQPQPSLSPSPSPPGEERIHMIVWQLSLQTS